MIPTDLLCYYPTNIAVIDDSDSFLAMVNKELDPKQARQLYNNPVEALQKINAAENSSDQLNSILKTLSNEDVDESSLATYDANALVHIDWKNFYKEAYNEKRFDRISVVLIDYRMEQMDGIEFCRNLLDKAIIKIMITEISDYKLAVQAFNEGLIDKFILKNNSGFFNEINNSIVKAQRDYFKNIYGLNGVLGFIFRDQIQCKSKDYYDLLCQIKNIINPVEGYVLDKSGSVLFLNEQAEPTWFIVRTKDELDVLYAIAKDNNAASDILNVLANKQEMPILLCEGDYQTAVKNWKLYPVKPFPVCNNSYYSILINSKFPILDTSKIISFKQYMSKNKQRFPIFGIV